MQPQSAFTARVGRRVQMVSYGRDFRLASRAGYSLIFKKGEPRDVPEECVDEAMAVGIVFVNDADAPSKDDAKVEIPAGRVRQEMVQEAIRALLSRNQRGDFTTGNKPHAQALSKALGWEVDARERDEAWDKFQNGELS